MPSAPKPTCPIYNDANVQAPPLTRQLDVPVPGQRDETIAAGSNNKLSWAGVFSLDHSQGVDLPQSLDNGAVSMTRDSRFLQAYLKNILANSVAGRTSMRIATPKQVLPIVAEHRVEWVQEILARGTGGGPELGDDVSDVFVTAGAIYAMLRMIPRRKDAVAAIYQLQWHGYYDDFPDLMLWAVLREFLKFLKGAITKQAALKSEGSLAKVLLDVCHVQAAEIGGGTGRQPVRCVIDLTEDLDEDEDDADDGEANGLANVDAEVARQDVNLEVPAAAVVNSSDRDQHDHSGSQSAAADSNTPVPDADTQEGAHPAAPSGSRKPSVLQILWGIVVLVVMLCIVALVLWASYRLGKCWRAGCRRKDFGL